MERELTVQERNFLQEVRREHALLPELQEEESSRHLLKRPLFYALLVLLGGGFATIIILYLSLRLEAFLGDDGIKLLQDPLFTTNSGLFKGVELSHLTEVVKIYEHRYLLMGGVLLITVLIACLLAVSDYYLERKKDD